MADVVNTDKKQAIVHLFNLLNTFQENNFVIISTDQLKQVLNTVGDIRTATYRGAFGEFTGETPLHRLAFCEPSTNVTQNSHLSVLKMLIEFGADVNAITVDSLSGDEGGFSPLHSAAYAGRIDVAALLLDSGAAVDGPTMKDIQTPLHVGVAEGKKDVVKLLLERGASLTRTSRRGLNVLHWAVCNHQTDLVSFLLESYPSVVNFVNASNEEGRTPLSEAKQRQFTDIVALLEKNQT